MNEEQPAIASPIPPLSLLHSSSRQPYPNPILIGLHSNIIQRTRLATGGSAEDLCVLCTVNQNHSSNASAAASSTVMLCPAVESLAKSESFRWERMTARSRSTVVQFPVPSLILKSKRSGILIQTESY